MATLGNEPKNFGDIQQRLDEIVLQVRSKDISLEKSLDLLEEGIRLGNAALESISNPEFSDAEKALYISEKAKQEDEEPQDEASDVADEQVEEASEL